MFFAFIAWVWERMCRCLSCIFSSGSGEKNRIVTFPQSGRVVRVNSAAPLGEGAFSFVYRAQQTNSSRDQHEHGSEPEQLALKKILLQSSETERCAHSEVAAFKRFQHPSILPLLDSVTLLEQQEHREGQGKVMYLLLPLIPQSLRDVLNTRMSPSTSSQSGVSLPTLASILADFYSICSALNVLHTFRPSYVHQDVKPENILIGEGGPLLMDFGSVRLAEVPIRDRSKALKVADDAAAYCTVSYRPPELFDPPTGLLLDCRTDVWAAGCLLFAWYYGLSPYECEFTDEELNQKEGERRGYGGKRACLRVVECSHLRVLAPLPRRAPELETTDDALVAGLVEEILQPGGTMSDRPFLTDVMVRVEEVMGRLEGSHSV